MASPTAIVKILKIRRSIHLLQVGSIYVVLNIIVKNRHNHFVFDTTMIISIFKKFQVHISSIPINK